MRKKYCFQPPYLGCAYYPEDWDESEIEYDIGMMKQAGINCVRIAEFAWSRMEPSPGCFDFTWLHQVVDKLAAEGIAVILGTPSATPPRWLSKLYPDALIEYANGRRASHGGRRHCCSNNPHYVEYSLRIAEKMAQEFADDAAVIGWQIDNEIYATDASQCFCPICHAKFIEYLRDRYGTVENLNRAWNLTIFSQEYENFEDIVTPRDAWHQPHILQAWKIFQQDSHIAFVHKQADILHKYVSVPIGTDIMPFNGMDYHKLQSKLDVAMFNHYDRPEMLWKSCLWFDYLRNMKKTPFWVTETHTCWSASVAIRQDIKPEGFCVINSLLPLALGGEANMYWLFRTHWAGHEMMHGAVLDTSGRPMHIFKEIQKTAATMALLKDFVNQTKVQTQVAMQNSSTNWNMLQTQAVVDGITTDEIYQFYRPILDLGLRPDVIDCEKSLANYKLLLSPLAMTLEEGDQARRIGEWVKNGGVWIVGPMSDIRTAAGTRYQHKPFGFLEELTGARWCYGVPDHKHMIEAEWTEAITAGQPFEGNLWYDAFVSEGGKSLAKIVSAHSELVGKACVLDCAVGKGHVILLGTFPGCENLKSILSYACELAGIPYGKTTGDVIVVERTGEKENCVMLLEFSGINEGIYRFNGGMTDVLTGEYHFNTVTLPPYGMMVLKK